MIISRIYKNLNQEQKDTLVWGLVVGLVSGLVVGLVSGLVWGLVLGLVSGLVVGLVSGLVSGLVVGLVSGLVWGLVLGLVVILFNWLEALPFLTGLYPIVFLILGIIILSEILFWLMPKEKVSKNKLFWHTCKRKVENIFEILLGLSVIAQIYILIRELKIRITIEFWQGILKWVGYIGLGIIILALVVGVFYIWIKLNSLKYKK